MKNPLLGQRKVTLDIDAEGKKWLANAGYDPVLWCPSAEADDPTRLQNPLAEKLLAGEIREGDSVQITVSPLGLLIHPGAHNDAEPERHAAERAEMGAAQPSGRARTTVMPGYPCWRLWHSLAEHLFLAMCVP